MCMMHRRGASVHTMFAVTAARIDPEDPLAGLGLGDRFEAVLNSAATGFEKPHPRAFALALASAGQPRVAWMIGDNPVADVGGAVAAGLRAILVRTSPPEPGIQHAVGLADIAAMVAAHP